MNAQSWPSCSLRGLLTVAVIALSAGSAQAHKVIASGYAAGDAIEGEVGFSNGDPATQATLIVTGPDGEILGEATTDGDGFFTFTPHKVVPHTFTADLGSGHLAQFRMEVEDLPRALRQAASAQAAALRSDAQPNAATGGVTAEAAGEAARSLPPEALRQLIAEAVREEVRPLRRELIASREQASLTSILGGLGTILGLVGVAFYMMARRKLADAAAQAQK